jgi:PAS domain S-box-containing protein
MPKSYILDKLKRGYQKYLLIFIAPILVVTAIYLFLILPSFRAAIYDEKILQTSEMVKIGTSALDRFYQLEAAGQMQRVEAQQEAKELIRSLHHGAEGLDYFWIVDLDGRMLVHPFQPELEGEITTDYQDREGNYPFQKMIEIATTESQGHLTYHWQYYDQEDRHDEKLSYVALFEPWGWIIGTGVYLSDLDAIMAQRRNYATIALIFLLLTIIALLYLYIKAKFTEEELFDSEEKYRLIAENTADTITVLDFNLNYLYVSPSIYSLRGYTPEEAMTSTLEETLTPDSLQLAMDTMQREMTLLAEGKIGPEKTIQLELEECHRNGSTVYVENTISFMRNDKGEPIGILVVGKDITERKKQQETLEKEKQEKTLILENLSEQVTYLDPEMRIIWANPAVSKLHNKTPQQYIGRKCYEVWHNFSEPCLLCPVIKALETGSFTEAIVTYSDGSYWKMSGSPVFDEQGNLVGVLDTALDITDLKRTETEMKKLNEELERRVQERTVELESAIKELKAFSYSVSHDLKAPLRSIKSFSEALQDKHGESLEDEALNYLKRINIASHRMGDLIEDLLKLSRVTSHELSCDQVNLSSMVEAYAVLLREKDPSRKVNVKVTPKMYVKGDASLLRIALDNLLDNAWKFTSLKENACIEFGLIYQDGKPVFFMRDNGIGLNISNAEKIFKAFTRLHGTGEYPGTGIGLSIVQRVIKRHGGSVWVEGEEGKGAVFYFTLPI